MKDNKHTDNKIVAAMHIQIDKTFNRKERIRSYTYLSVIQYKLYIFGTNASSTYSKAVVIVTV